VSELNKKQKIRKVSEKIFGTAHTDKILDLYKSSQREANLFPFTPWMLRTKAIFIHIPKCAGTSVLSTMGHSKYRSHYPFYIYKEANFYKYRRYFKFSFVRNPWSRMFSVYNYLKNGGNGAEDLKLAVSIKDISFEDFIKNWLTLEKIHSIRLLHPQHSFIYNPFEKKLEVDFLGKVENFQSDMRFICEKLGLEYIEHKNNVSSESNYRDYYNEETIEIVRNLYSFDVELFGYIYER